MKQSDTSFFLSNIMKSCTTSRLIEGNQLLACNLGTKFAMLCTIYYLLYGSEIFSVFLYEVTVLLKKLKKKALINVVKLVLTFLLETGSVKLSDMFSFAEWTKRVFRVLSTIST